MEGTLTVRYILGVLWSGVIVKNRATISKCDRLRENRAQRGVRNIEIRSIDFLKMYCFKPTEGNG